MAFRTSSLAIFLGLLLSVPLWAQSNGPTMSDQAADALSGPAWAPRNLRNAKGSVLNRFPALPPAPAGGRWATHLTPPKFDSKVLPLGQAQPPNRLSQRSNRYGVRQASQVVADGPAEGVTMHLDNVDVRQVLEMLSRTYGKSILVAPEVKGAVTVNFEKIPIDNALAAILKLCNLVAKQDGELLFVYSKESFPQANLEVRVFTLDFAGADEVLPTVEGMLSASGKAYSRKISPDDNRLHREAVIVSDMPESLARIAAYIAEADQPPLQVMIEANVLKITLTDELQHGINYKQAMNAMGGTLELETTGFANPLATPAVFARIQGNQVDSLIQLLKTTTDAKTLASPRVMVINGQKARIQVGNQLGYKVVTVTETAAVEEIKFLEVGIVLEVTPRISRDGRVIMNVKPKVSDGEINTETLLPEEQTSELESNVMLADGQGVVIGGLIQERDSDIQQKLPVLGDMYLLGRLFQKKQTVKERSEIVVTLVPRIVHAGGPVTERDMIQHEQATQPLFHGPLYRTDRPWEPRLPDAVDNPYRNVYPCPLHRGRHCDCVAEPPLEGPKPQPAQQPAPSSRQQPLLQQPQSATRTIRD